MTLPPAENEQYEDEPGGVLICCLAVAVMAGGAIIGLALLVNWIGGK